MLLWLSLGVLFLGSGLERPFVVGASKDWALHTQMTMSSHRSWVIYRQYPAWDPYDCGGISGASNLQNNGSSPTQLFLWIFGFWAGWKLAMLALLVLGCEGAYQYCLVRGVRGIAALLAGVLFGFSGRITQAFVDGHPHFLGFLLFPWLLVALERGARDDWRHWLLGGLFWAWMFNDGGVVTTPMSAMVLAFHSLALVLERAFQREARPTWYRPLVGFAVMGLVGAALSAATVLPAISDWLAFPRVWLRTEHYSLGKLFGLLFERTRHEGFIVEGTSYIGTWTAVLFLAALLSRDRRAAALLALIVATLLMATGDGGVSGLYDLQKKLPIYRNLRNPFRYTLFTGLYLSLGAALGVDLLERGLVRLGEARAAASPRWFAAARRPIASVAVVLLTLGVAAFSAHDVFGHNRLRMLRVWNTDAPARYEQPFRQSLGNPWDAYVWSSLNLGSLICFQAQAFPESRALKPNLAHEEYLSDPKAGRVRRVSWTPHRIELDVDLRYRTGLILNQNAHRGWNVSRGEIVDFRGLLAARIPAGSYRLVVYFSDPLVNYGTIISLLALSLVAYAGLRRRQ